LTGDITFSNGTQNLIGPNGFNVPLTFGLGFTTGTLCVFTISSLGLSSDTICMTINAPVGINENINASNVVYFNNESNDLVILSAQKTGATYLKLYDVTGR